MKKILIITYYWPPSGGAGVQRWLKFAKYLRNFGWEPVIYTPLNPEFPAIDNTLAKDIPADVEVIRTPIWEPYEFYKKFTGKKSTTKINSGFLNDKKSPGLVEQLSVWIRGNLFIPDARKFWIKPSVRFLTKYLKENHVDAIVSTGPPHSMHLIALAIKTRLNIPWLADFRDPWTDIDYYKDLEDLCIRR
jgi:glycosyltransferase involved in cell wall biosynthesis